MAQTLLDLQFSGICIWVCCRRFFLHLEGSCLKLITSCFYQLLFSSLLALI